MPISALSSISTGANALGNLLLVSPKSTLGYQPQSTPSNGGLPSVQLPSLLFHYEGENSVAVESDVTDNYIEDNTAIQDQVALRPVIITAQGFIGELNDIPPNKVFAAAQVVAQKLTAIGAYTPGLSATALLAYNEAVFTYQTILNTANNAITAWSSLAPASLGGGTSVSINGNLSLAPNQTKQQTYYQQFFGYWSSRTLFTVQTPWVIFENMIIQSLKATQSAETRMITDFEITFKQLRFAQIETTETLYNDITEFQSRLQNQGASLTNLGSANLTTSPTSFLSTVA